MRSMFSYSCHRIASLKNYKVSTGIGLCRYLKFMQHPANMNFQQLEELYAKKLKEELKDNDHSLCPSPIKKKEIAELYNNLGHSKYMQVKFDAAVEDYSRAIELDETLAAAFYNRGTIYYRMGCYEQALQDFKKAVSLDSDNEEFQAGLESCKKCYS